MKAEEIKHFKPLLAEFFAADPALIERWHIYAGKGLRACVRKTYRDLRHSQIRFFKLSEGEKAVGYFGKEENFGADFLTGFFLHPEHRDLDTKAKFWLLVEAELGRRFFCGIYEKNTPAKKFVEAHGGAIVRRFTLTDGEAVFYKLGA